MVYDPGSAETKAAQERANRLALMKLRERLAEGYKDAPSHFLLELAQNAYDAMAKNLQISLVRNPGPVGDLLIVWNDGEPFKKNQFSSIIGAWSSTKVEGQAGRFGIGFKSVYFHAECADLLSGEFRYRMPRKPWDPSEEWPPEVPETDRKWGLERNLSAADWEPYQQHLPPQVRKALSSGGEIPNSCFVLHLEDGAGDRLVEAIRTGGNLRPDLLLFLQGEDHQDGQVRMKSLESVSILGMARREIRITKREIGPWLGWARPIGMDVNVSDVECRLEGVEEKDPPPSRYRVYREVGGISRASIAMPIESRDSDVVEGVLDESSRQLWAWFPTKVQVPWGFLAQCDFHLLPNREDLDASRPESVDHNKRALASLMGLLAQVLAGLCGEVGPLPISWQKALLDTLKDFKKGPQGPQDVLQVNEIARDQIIRFLRSNPGLSSNDTGGGIGVPTSSAIIVVTGAWNKEQYDLLTQLVEPSHLPHIREGDPKRRDQSEKDFSGRRWLSWSWVQGGVSDNVWEMLDVRVATRLDLALHCKSEAMQPLHDEMNPRWVEWVDLLARLSWNVKDMESLQTGLRWPVIQANGNQGVGFEPLFIRDGARHIRINLYDPIEADGYPVKRVHLQPADGQRAEPLLIWAREHLKMRGPDMRELLKVALFSGEGAIPTANSRDWPVADEDATRIAAGHFRDVLTWMTAKDRDELANRAFIPARNARGEPALRSPRSCLMKPDANDMDDPAGFEAFLEATDQWVIAPELLGFQDPIIQDEDMEEPLRWLDQPLREGQYSPSILLKAWGVQDALEPSWVSRSWGLEVSEAWIKTGSKPKRQVDGLTLHIPTLSGLKEACKSVCQAGDRSGPLFRFLWARLSRLASLNDSFYSSKFLQDRYPLQWVLQRENRGSFFEVVPGMGPVGILTDTEWIPLEDGGVALPTDVDATELITLLGETQINRAGHGRLVDLLGFRIPGGGDTENALSPMELEEKYRELQRRVEEMEMEAEQARVEAQTARAEVASAISIAEKTQEEFESYKAEHPPTGGVAGGSIQWGLEKIEPDIPVNELPMLPEEGLSESDIEAALNLLSSRLGASLFPYASQVAPGLPEGSPLEAARIILQFHMDGLLGSDTCAAGGGPRLRDALIEDLFRRNRDDGEWNDYVKRILGLSNRNPEADDLTARNWYAGSPWARWVTWLIQLPPAFAGRPAEPKAPAEEVCIPPRRPGKLRDYQRQLVDAATASRALIEVPTGGGKTRIAAEIVLNRLAEPQHAGRAILWLAPGAELCEQAISALRDLHVARSITELGEEPRPLAFRRWYDGNNRERVLHPEGVAGTVIACTYQTLEGMDPVELERLSPSVVLGVLDEAHRSVATAWRQPIDRLMAGGVPFLGLSATPDGAIQLLGQPVGMGCFGNEDPQAALVRDGVLAKPVKVEIRYDGERMPEIDLTEDEEAEPRGATEPWRGALARHPQRREAIGVWIQSHLIATAGARVLFFGSSLVDAVGMTAWLRQRGVPAELVSGRVRGPVRRRILAKFHEGEVQVLCNFGVLTTGIDEPLITAVVIARPTGSLTLYTQMAGRGLRGPGASGTEECLIADVLDTSHPRLAKDRWWRRQDRMV